MQLSGTARTAPRRRQRTIVLAVTSLLLAVAPHARADTKTVALDFATYEDTDHVTVSTPSVRLGWTTAPV